MTAHAAVASVAPRRVTREIALGCLVTAAIAGLLHVLGPAPGDAPAHLYRTLLVRHGALV